MNILADYLFSLFPEVEPMDFYRALFPDGALDEYREHPAEREGHRYTGIIVQVLNEKKENGQQRINRFTVTNDLDEIDRVIWSKDFSIMSPISYVGKARKSENARFLYALVVELDHLLVSKNGTQRGLKNLINQWSEKVHWIPRPTFTVASGTGVHLYFLFDKPIPLFPNVVKALQAYKRQLTKMIWNRHTTADFTEEKIQYESIFQGFRMVGSITKKGDRVRAFRTGSPVSIEYMNSYIPRDLRKRHPEVLITQLYKSDLTLASAREKYPDWYERRIVRKEPKGHWICSRAVYDWWLQRIEDGAVVGHRFFCMMILAIYAVKCEISREELERDCLRLTKIFEKKTEEDSNHFTEKDMLDALQAFEDKTLITYPVNSISNRSGILIEKNKRNHRKQAQHLKIARATLAIMNEDNGKALQGRPSKEEIVRQWQNENLTGRKADCIRDTGLDKKTVYRWWTERN